MGIKRKYINIIAILLILTVVLIGMAYTINVSCSKIKKIDEENDNYNINRVHATYAIDMTRLSDLVADVDYCFVGNVEKIVGTVYKHSCNINGEEVGIPYTKYRVKVIKNIKGQLNQGRIIEIMKAGGKESNSNIYTMYEGDNLPNVKENYIFSTYVQKDGNLLASGTNSTIRISEAYTKSDTYNVMFKNRNKELNRNRKRYKINTRKVYKVY